MLLCFYKTTETPIALIVLSCWKQNVCKYYNQKTILKERSIVYIRMGFPLA